MDLKIIIGGDFCPGRAAEHVALERPDRIWGSALELIRGADLSIVNLESPLTEASNPILKIGPNLRSHPAIVHTLVEAQIDVVTLANNHIYDHGATGLRDTLDTCRRVGIETVGAGQDLNEARETLYKRVRGKTVALVNFAENEWCNAREDRGGANPMDLIDNTAQIRQAAECADVVLVIIHGGHENYSYPSPRMVKQYRYYAEQGAAAIIAHHTHCISGYERHKGVPIFYSLGNLYFPYEGMDDRWHEGILLELSIKPNGEIAFTIHPIEQCRGMRLELTLLASDAKESVLKRIRDISAVIADRSELASKWDTYIQSQRSRLPILTVKNRVVRAVVFRLQKMGVPIGRFFSLEKLMNISNQFQCEAHRDVMSEVLSRHFEDHGNRD